MLNNEQTKRISRNLLRFVITLIPTGICQAASLEAHVVTPGGRATSSGYQLEASTIGETAYGQSANGNLSGFWGFVPHATLTIEDTTPPVLTCPGNLTVSCSVNNLSTGATGVATATDNISDPSAIIIDFADSVVTDCGNIARTITRVWTATDEASNSTTCTQTISVVDVVDPIALCSDITRQLYGASVTITAAELDNGSYDDCGSVSLAISTNTFTSTGTNSVVLTVTDECGNSTTCTAMVTIELPPSLDYGDAPNASQSGLSGSYPVLFADDGARHQPSGPRLGSRDAEINGIPASDALGDDTDSTDDEDGVVFLTTFVTNGTGLISVDLQNPDQAANILNLWIDWDRNGSWQDAGEHVMVDLALGTSAGAQQFSIAVPATAQVGDTYARARLSTAGGDATTGQAADGEVEDHKLTVSGSGADASVDLPAVAGDYMAIREGDDLVLKRGTLVVFSAPIADLNSFTVSCPPSAPIKLDLQFSGGDFIPVGGMSFNGSYTHGDFVLPKNVNLTFTHVSYGPTGITFGSGGSSKVVTLNLVP